MANWLFEETLKFGGGPPIGVVTLWTQLKKFDGLSPNSFRVMGHLYSTDGVNYIARNVLTHPEEVRVIIVCGSDGILEETGVREAILCWQITDPMIPQDERKWLAENVSVIDGGTNQGRLLELLQVAARKVNVLRRLNKEPAIFPFPQTTTATFPSEITGMRVVWSTIYEAWVDVLRHILRFGISEGKRKILLNLVSVIGEEEILGSIGLRLGFRPKNGVEFILPAFLNFGELWGYIQKFLDPELPTDVTYAYGNRLLRWGHQERMNLVDWGLAKLRQNHQDSQVVLGLWDNRIDTQFKDPPCLTQIILNVLEDRLYLTAMYRSHDMFRAYFSNLAALRYAQMLWARELGVGLGRLTTVSTNAHIYTWDLAAAEEIVRSAPRPKCVYDPRGNIAVTRLGDEIVVILYGPNGQKLTEYKGKNPRRLLQRLLDDEALGQSAHWAYAAVLLMCGKEI